MRRDANEGAEGKGRIAAQSRAVQQKASPTNLHHLPQTEQLTKGQGCSWDPQFAMGLRAKQHSNPNTTYAHAFPLHPPLQLRVLGEILELEAMQ